MLLASNVTAPHELLIKNHGFLVLAFIFLMFGLAVVRWSSVRRSIFSLEDPRTYAILRIIFALLTFWLFYNPIEHWRNFFSDEGLYTMYDARFKLGGDALAQWDPKEGFQSVEAVLHFIWNRGSLLYLDSSPEFVRLHMWGFFGVLFFYGIGFFTRTMGVLAFFLLLSIYNRNASYLEGTDSVFKCFWFLLMFAKTGHAWSVDNWLRCWRLRRKGLLKNPGAIPSDGRILHPVYRLVPAWPRYLFIFQLTVLYVRTGTLKFGRIWNAGDSLYYALNNTHFYRFEYFTQHMSAWLVSNVFRLNTWTTLWWERLFFLVLFGLGARFVARHREEPWLKAEFSGVRGWIQRGIWVALWAVLWRVNTLGLTPNDDAHTYGVPPALHLAYGLGIPACYLLWRDAADTKDPLVFFPKGLTLPKGIKIKPILVDQPLLRAIFLSRRTLLGLGTMFHGFLILFINLGLFPFIMIGTYPSFFAGDEFCKVFLKLGRRFFGSGSWERFFQPAAEEPKSRWLKAWAAPTVGENSPRIAYGLVGTTVVGLAMGYHVLAISLRLFQPPPPLLETRNWLINQLQTDEWLSHSRTWQGWGMFPSPPTSSGDLETTIVTEKGEEVVLPKRLPYEKRTIEIAYDRERKLRRRIARENGKQYRRLWAMFQCREYELRTGERPKRVILHDISTKIPSVKWVRKHGVYKTSKLEIHRKKLGTYSCTGSGQVPAYMKRRRGLELTRSDERREKILEARLERTFPKPPYRPESEKKKKPTSHSKKSPAPPPQRHPSARDERKPSTTKSTGDEKDKAPQTK